jgi:hypothetical protein
VKGRGFRHSGPGRTASAWKFAAATEIAMTEAEFLEAAFANPVNCAILERLESVGCADAWLVSGALFQSVWNRLSGRPPRHGIRDYDIFYFDSDPSWEAEDAVIRRAASV